MLFRVLCTIFLVHSCVAAPNSRIDYEDSRENAVSSPSLARTEQTHYFDLLIFTQRWPITACYEWRETGKDHICGLPTPIATVWTIHGIWPTKLNTIGPAFCNKSAVFDVSQLTAIEADLEEHWLNVEKNKPDDSLWEHEWLKHGTCAAEQIDDLNTERKYFGQGLSWLEQHSVGAAFTASGNIQPGFNYSLSTLNKALFDYYGKDVAIECFYDRKTHQQYLNEVRICFDKQLQLTDCDGIVGLERVSLPYTRIRSVISNCNAAKPILYPNGVPKDLLLAKEQSKGAVEEVLLESVYEFANEERGAPQSYEFVEVIVL